MSRKTRVVIVLVLFSLYIIGIIICIISKSIKDFDIFAVIYSISVTILLTISVIWLAIYDRRQFEKELYTYMSTKEKRLEKLKSLKIKP